MIASASASSKVETGWMILASSPNSKVIEQANNSVLNLET